MKNKLSRINKFVLWSTITITLIISFFILFNKVSGDCVGCGGCEYKPFKETVFISSYKLDENNIIKQVNFSVKGKKSNGLMFINGSALSDFGLDTFAVNKLNDKSLYYQISGGKIVRGTCQPYTIKKLKRR